MQKFVLKVIVSIADHARCNSFTRKQSRFALCFTRSFRYNISMGKILATLLLLLFLGVQTTPAFAFSFFKKKDPKPVKNVPTEGYKGTLPSVERYFEYKKEGTQSSPERVREGKPDSGNLMKAPLNDDLFLDVIIQKDRPSPYIKDMLAILDLLEKIYYTLLEENLSIQKYNAQANMLDLNVSTLLKNYASSSYNASPSYAWAQRAAYSVKVFGNLIYDARYYSRYVSVTDGQYSAKNIQKEKEKLIGELDKAAFAIRQLE